jgi:hypothetical protein
MVKNNNRVEEIMALVGIYLSSGRQSEARKLLEGTKSEFIESKAESQWALSFAQVLIAEGNPKAALDLASLEDDRTVNLHIQSMALAEISRKSGEWQPLVEHLENAINVTGESDYLWELVQLKLELRDWNYVADHAQELIEKVKTADAVRIAAVAAWNAQRLEQCNLILTENISFFPNGVLPPDLWRLRVQCELRAGMLAHAVADAQALMQQHNTTENVLTLMDAMIRTGDLKGAVVVGRTLLQRDRVDARTLLLAARSVYLEQVDLAQEFWRRAKTSVLDDPVLLSDAVSLGFILGLDSEIGPLMHRMQEFAAKGEGPFKVFDLKQVSSFMKERSEHVEEVYQKYGAAAVPIHLLARVIRVTLAEVLHGVPQRNRLATDLRRQSVIFSRHGGRSIDALPLAAPDTWRLHVDVTALLTAEHLGMLDKVEQRFKPLYISPVLPEALVNQITELYPHQPSRFEDYQEIINLVERKKLRQIEITEEENGFPELAEKLGQKRVNIISTAQKAGGYVVDYLPLTNINLDFHHEVVTLPPELRGHVIDCRAVINSLRSNGRLSEIRFNEALASLGSIAAAEVGAVEPPLGSSLYLLGNIAGVLADAQVLDLLSSNFRVFIEPEQVKEAYAVMREKEHRADVQKWVERLADRVRDGLQRGLYEAVSVPAAWEQSAVDNENVRDLDFRTAADLLRYDASDDDVIWIDDRCINSYLTRDSKVPIIGINEVLASILSAGDIDEHEYFSRLLSLRTGNFRYIPIDSREILYHLNQAHSSGGITETPELSVLRRYVAACLLDRKHLQIPPLPEGSPNPSGEVPFVLETTRTVLDAVIDLWADPEVSAETASTWSDWLLHNLYTGGFGVRHLLPNSHLRGDAIDLLGIDIGGAYVKGFVIREGARDVDGQMSRRKQFFDWLETRIALRRFKVDLQTLSIAAKVVENIIIEAATNPYDSVDLETARRAVMQQWFVDLPEDVKNHLNLEPRVWKWLAVKMVKAVPVGRLSFPVSSYWRAIEKAVNGQTVSIRVQNNGGKFKLQKAATEGDALPHIQVIDAEGQVVARVQDPVMELFLRDRSKREEVLRNHRFWFDCEQSVFEKEVRRIVTLSNPSKLIERVNGWRSKSIELFYRGIEEQTAVTKYITWASLTPPSGDSLLNYYRLKVATDGETITDFAEFLQKSILTVIDEEGLLAALDRFASLPINLPQRAVEEVSKLSEEKRVALLQQLAARWFSPVSKLHLVELALGSAPDEDSTRDLARSALQNLYDDAYEADFKLFHELLSFVNKEFASWNDAREWPAQIKLAMIWAHASRLHNLFIAVSPTPEAFTQVFESENQHMSPDILARDPALWNDLLHPRRFSRVTFLTHGVASVLSGINQQALESLSAADLIRDFAFGGESGAKLLDLIRDPQLANDSVGSFFGGDRAEVLAGVVGEESVKVLSSPNLQDLVRQAIEELQLDPSQRSWANLLAVVGDLPLYLELREQFSSLVIGLDIVTMIDSDPSTARLALRAIANQAPYQFDEGIRTKLEEGLIELTRIRSVINEEKESEEDKPPEEASVAILIEGALMWALQLNDPRATSAAWSSLLRKLVDIWPGISRFVGREISKIVFDLPGSQLHGVWELVLTLRAVNEDAL